MKDFDKQNAEVRVFLDTVLDSRKALLVVGAGCSVDLGYPSWSSLLNILKGKFAPDIKLPVTDPARTAYEIKKAANLAFSDLTVYERTVEDIFRPKEPNCLPFHCELVRLGFAGIATVNYDTVLESAISTAFSDKHSYCQTLNLCHLDDRHRIERYLRKLYDPPERPTAILHLHGTYDKPENLVLSWDDYECHYNDASRNDQLTVDASKGEGFTFHRRVLWSLLTTRSLVFAGFGSDDAYFNNMMDVWHSDFNLREERAHVAIVGVTSESERERWDNYLYRKGVLPLFYDVPPDNPSNHRALHSIVHEIASRRHVQYQAQPSLSKLNARMLDMR
jgi:hypothetical protein